MYGGDVAHQLRGREDKCGPDSK